MNTRTPIQPSNVPAVLALAFSVSRNRFVAGLSDGIRVFRTDNCLATYRPTLPADGGVAIVAVLDDRYLALVAGGRNPAGSPHILIFWDCLQDKEVTRLDFYEPVLALRLNERCIVVVLQNRAVVLDYQQFPAGQKRSPSPEDSDEDEARTDTGLDDQDVLKGPNLCKSLHATSANPYGVVGLSKDLLVLPAPTVGQVQLVSLTGASKRVLRAHNTALRHIALSPSGDLLATASEQGTLIRVFDTHTLDQLAEFRRGVEKAVIYQMAFSHAARWLAVSSDKGTVHVFDLRPASPTTADQRAFTTHNPKSTHQHRKSQSNPIHRLSGGGIEKESLSGRSSPSTVTTAHQGSIQEYYGLRPPPASASPTGREAAATAISAFKSSPFAPKIFKDTRSMASLPFYVGSDPPHWQGGTAYSWTTTPDGTRKRIRNPIPPLPADPAGRPPKGAVAFAAKQNGLNGGNDDEGAVFYVLAGGSDARWEMFELLPTKGDGWIMVNRGFRKYLTKQFVD